MNWRTTRARGQLKAIWWVIFTINAANLCLHVRYPTIVDITLWPAAIGVAGLVVSVLALRSFSRDERRQQVVKVFE